MRLKKSPLDGTSGIMESHDPAIFIAAHA